MNRLSLLGLSNSSQGNSPSSSPTASQAAPPTSLLKMHRDESPASLLATSGSAWTPAAKIVRPRAFFVPTRYTATYRYPLIVWLHNDGYNESQISQVAPHISTQNYVGVGIRGSQAIDQAGKRFAWSESSAAVSRCEDAVWQAIDDAGDRYNIHGERIFIAGYGAGATMARRIAMRRSRQFAGCIALGGRMPRGGSVMSDLAGVRNLRNFWALAIDGDQVASCDFDDDIRLAADARMKIDVRQYTTDDVMVKEVLSDVNHWVMQIVTGTPTPPPADAWSSVPVGFSAN